MRLLEFLPEPLLEQRRHGDVGAPMALLVLVEPLRHDASVRNVNAHVPPTRGFLK